jgi:hypothetical protein
VIAQKMLALLHFLSTVFATIEVEERIEVRPQAEPQGTEMQFGFVLNRLGVQKRPIWTVYICGMETISAFSSVTCGGNLKPEWVPLPPVLYVKL